MARFLRALVKVDKFRGGNESRGHAPGSSQRSARQPTTGIAPLIGALSLLLITLLFSPDGNARFPYAPEGIETGSLCTPRDPHFLSYRYQEQIPYCERNVKESVKSKVFAAYGVPQRCRHEYTIDHFIPLALGGSNRSDNLWPEHKRVKAVRHDLELNLYLALKNNQIRQVQAVQAIIEAKLRPPIEKINLKDICR